MCPTRSGEQPSMRTRTRSLRVRPAGIATFRKLSVSTVVPFAFAALLLVGFLVYGGRAITGAMLIGTRRLFDCARDNPASWDCQSRKATQPLADGQKSGET